MTTVFRTLLILTTLTGAACGNFSEKQANPCNYSTKDAWYLTLRENNQEPERIQNERIDCVIFDRTAYCDEAFSALDSQVVDKVDRHLDRGSGMYDTFLVDHQTGQHEQCDPSGTMKLFPDQR